MPTETYGFGETCVPFQNASKKHNIMVNPFSIQTQRRQTQGYP